MPFIISAAFISCCGADQVAGEEWRTSIVPSRDTTHIVKPLRADGTVDYVRAVNERASRGVTLENNAAVLLLQALGPEYEGFTEGWLRDVSAELGLQPLAKEPYRFQLLEEVLRREHPDWNDDRTHEYVQNHEHRGLFSTVSRPWTRAEYSEIARWIDENEEELKLVHEASRRPLQFVPIGFNSEPIEGRWARLVAAEHLFASAQRQLAKCLATRAMLHLGEGRDAEAMADLEAIHRLAHLLGHRSRTVLDFLIAVGIHTIAWNGDRALIARASFSEREWLAYRDRLDRLPAFRSISEVYDQSVRWEVLEAVAVLSHPKTDELFGEENDLKFLLGQPLNWNVILRHINTRYDRWIDAAMIENYHQREARFDQLDDRFVQIRRDLRHPGPIALLVRTFGPRRLRSIVAGETIFQLLMHSVQQASHTQDRMHAKRNVLRLALTVAAYHARTGEYPVTLDDLTPDFLKAIPEDIYTGQPLRYRREKEGFQVWSVGKNQEDDRGRWSGVSREDEDDITIRKPLRSMFAD